MIRSFRARLTLWNVVVLAVALIAFSVAVAFANQSRLRGEIDRELQDRALHAPPEGPPRPPGLGAGPRFNDPPAPGFDLRRPRRFGLDGNPMRPPFDPPFDLRSLRLALTGRPNYADGNFDGAPIRIFTTPFRSPDGQIRGVVQVARETAQVDRIWASQLVTLAILLPGALALAALGAFFLTGRAMKPIARMEAAAGAISSTDLSRRLNVSGDDEFAQLGATFDAMIERLEGAFHEISAAYRELEAAHETQKRFTADASHELRTPLTRLRLATSAALRPEANDEERAAALRTADDAAQSMTKLVQEMLVLARADAGQLAIRREPLDLRVVVSEALERLPAGGAAIQVHFDEAPVSIVGDPDQIARVVLNLVDNARRHTPAEGRIDVAVSRPGTLSVSDSGEGIAAAHLPRLGDRFYRVDSARSREDGGSGLGLAICRTILVAHGGTLEIESEIGLGTTVLAKFPQESRDQTISS